MMNKWHNCYDEGWKDIIVPEAFSHPAKMSYGLLKRILAHIKEQGWGGVIIDPFGGIGSTGILGAYEGYQVVCVELERKFVDLARKNFVIHNNIWQKLGCPYPVIFQGDSRQLCQIVEKADTIISSPPFVDCEHNYKHGLKVLGDNFKGRKAWETKGGTIEKADIIIVSSPPFSNLTRDANLPYLKERLSGEYDKKRGYKPNKNTYTISDGYGQTPGQLGAMKPGKVDMVVSSPPYAGALGNRQHEGDQKKYLARQQKYNEAHPEHKRPSAESMCYPCSEGNIAALKSGDVDLVLSSPPYEGSMNNENCGIDWSKAKKDYPGRVIHDKRIAMHQKHHTNRKYGDSEEQLGSQTGDTFWSAAKIIIEQCFQILKPCGHAIWVVKSFVRKGKIVDFPGDWQRLCESVGFKTVCVHHAMLVKETTHTTLFGHTEIKRKERKSFFRRLAEAKGSPRIDFEIVLCMSK